jgi:hypothetical protein
MTIRNLVINGHDYDIFTTEDGHPDLIYPKDTVKHRDFFERLHDPADDGDGKYCGFDSLDAYWEAFYNATINARNAGLDGVTSVHKLFEAYDPDEFTITHTPHTPQEQDDDEEI